jgi:anti-sigma28 factor (negative regulator of flagellin synthesis)
MKIDSNTLNAISQSQIGATALGSGKTHSGARHAGGDKVQISDMASLLSSDPQKLAQLTAAVQNGTYNISPSQIANSMLNEMMQL